VTTAHASDDVERSIRERLLEAAAEVFAEQGYDRARVQQIARRAGLSTGAIYANFRDKSELLAETISIGLRQMSQTLKHERRAGASASQLLEVQGRTILTGTPTRYRLLLTEALAAARRDPHVGTKVRAGLTDIQTRLAKLFNTARHETHASDDIDPNVMAHFAIAVALGYHAMSAAGVPPPDPTDWNRLMGRALRPRPGPASRTTRTNR
jgi:AcrR family transcriptional regulator